jgi:L,D-transpeptidase ErfK/SrfK
MLLFGALSGCAVLHDDTAETREPVVLEEPPIVSDRFVLQSADQQLIGTLQVIKAAEQDTFVDIARTYNLGFDELVQANPDVDPWLPGEGTRVLLPTRFILPGDVREGIVLNLASKRLFYYLPPNEEGLRAVVTHPIGIGRSGWATPEGGTEVISKGRDPVWYVPASIRREHAAAGNPLPAEVPPGPDNPLGRYVLILAMPSYLIHGTNKPAGVGMRVSHGCIRLFPEDIEHLYKAAPVGVAVTIINQPRLLAWQDGSLYVEVHPALEDDERDWSQRFPEMLDAVLQSAPNGYANPDLERINAIIAAGQGIPLPVLNSDPDTARVLSAATLVHNLVVVPEVEREPEPLAYEARD